MTIAQGDTILATDIANISTAAANALSVANAASASATAALTAAQDAQTTAGAALEGPTTPFDILVGINGGGVGYIAPGAAGTVLTSNGTAAAPSFQALPAETGGSTGSSAVTLTVGATAVGNSQATAYAITTEETFFTTVAAGTCAVLNSALPVQVVYNRGANPLTVYPFVGADIEATGTNEPVTIEAPGSAVFRVATSTQVYTGA